MKKLVFIINSLTGGGAERVASILLNNNFFLERYEVHLVLLEKEVRYGFNEKVVLHKITTLDQNASQFRKLFTFPAMLEKVRKIKRVLRPNYSLSFLTRSNIINILTHMDNERVLIGVHNNMQRYFETYKGRALIQKPIIKSLYNRAEQVIAVSEGVKDSLLRSAGLKPEKITVVYNPFDIDKIKKGADEEMSEGHKNLFAGKKIIITIGRLIAQKAFHILIDAFAKLREPDLHLAIIGQGELEEKLRTQVCRLVLNNCVHFLGWQDNPYKFLSRAHLFVSSSIFEGLANVLVEAMACGCPVVSTDCNSGPREMLGDNKYGLLAKVNDVDDLAEKILTMLSNDRLRKHYASVGAERAMDFHVDKIMEKYIKVIENK